MDIVAKRAINDEAFLDENRTVLAAEVWYAVSVERAVTLVDIMHRRMMIGLSSDQGRALADKIGTLAADAAGWNKAELGKQRGLLEEYNDRLSVSAMPD